MVVMAITTKNQKRQKKAMCILLVLSGTIGFLAWCNFLMVFTIVQSPYPFNYNNQFFDSLQTKMQHRSLHTIEDERQQQPLPKTTAAQVNYEAVGACLLIMDDNHWLIEWLAYHYYAVPLTHLVVAVDPESRTSPESILSRYRGKIKIKVWNDADIIIPRSKIEAASKVFSVRRHRLRQTHFYQKCMKHHKSQGISVSRYN